VPCWVVCALLYDDSCPEGRAKGALYHAATQLHRYEWFVVSALALHLGE